MISKEELKNRIVNACENVIAAEAELTEIDRRRLVFSVRAFAGEELIGEGRHERFIVDNEKFMRKALDKLK